MSEYHKVFKARTIYGGDLLECTEGDYLNQFKIKYFSDLIVLEIVWSKIDAVVLPASSGAEKKVREDVPARIEVVEKVNEETLATQTTPEIASTEEASAELLQLRLTELEWAQKVYDGVVEVTSKLNTPVYFDVESREWTLSSIVEDLVLTKEKLAKVEETCQRLKEI